VEAVTDSAPYQPHSPTSRAAADEIVSEASRLRRRVLAHVLLSAGSTDEEGQDALNMPGNTYRPRRVELEQAGKVRASGQHRTTKSGRLAVVWIAAPPQPQPTFQGVPLPYERDIGGQGARFGAEGLGDPA
jgi:hypothetical protein